MTVLGELVEYFQKETTMAHKQALFPQLTI